MRCEEIRENIVDLLYDEPGASPANPELVAHVQSCPACQSELRGLKDVQSKLALWDDAAPLRPVALPVSFSPRPKVKLTFWHVTRRFAMAAAVVLAFLALGNADITWEKGRFSFKTGLLPGRESQPDYYSKTQTRDLMRRALDESEGRMMETNYIMMQRVLETMEQERWSDLRLMQVRRSDARSRN